MKKIFRNLKFGLMLCAGAFAASCSDIDEAMNEIPYTRVLTPLNFEADVDAAVGTDIKFSWSAVSNADAYILELFEAVPTIKEEDGKEVEIYEMPENFDSSNAYQTVEVAKDGVPFTVKNLAVDKTFWARVQGVSAKIESSRWAYLVEAVSTSAVRSALNPKAKERTETTVTVQWDQNAKDPKDLTSIRYELVVPVEGATATVMPLSDEQISACEAKIENLEPSTNYKFTLLFGKSGSRGHFTAYTRPSTEGTTKIANSADFAAAITGATGDLKLLLAYNGGEAYDLTSNMTKPADSPEFDPYTFAYGLEIYGESSPEGAKPVVKGSFKMTGENANIHFEDVLIDGGNECGYFITTGATLGNAEFINCEFTGFTKGLWSGADKFNVENLIYDGIYAHDINPIGSAGGDFIDLRIKAGSKYGTIEIKNSTFYACARTFLRCREGGSVGTVNVANCTFNQVTATISSSNNSGIFELQKFTPAAVNLTKCVFLNENHPNEVPEQDGKQWVKLTGTKDTNIAPICAGNYFYNVGTTDKNGKNFFLNQKSKDLNGQALTQELALAEGGMILTEDPCTNSIAGKLYLKNGAIAANKAGDPRWWNASAPVVVRPTELEPIAEAAAWDFTDKTKFDTETVEGQTIIENIRIYGPAEIVMSTGISFAQAATITNKGVPTASAFEFKADGYGSIEMTAQGKSVTSTVQIVAGGDTYSIIADGKPHKVVLGDLVGVNSIYVLPGSDNTSFTRIAWTKDTTPENTVTALATPVLTLNETSIDEGTQQAVTATWEHNAHAEKYTVTFNSSTTDVTEPAFEIPAATIAALAAGEYTISVVAQPTSTSTKYTPSEAGEAKFKIKKPVVGVEKKIKWDFTAFDGTNITGGTWTSNVKLTETIVWNVNADCPLTIMKDVAVEQGVQAKMQDGKAYADGSIPTTRALAFTAPGAGTLTIVQKAGNATATDRNTWVSVDGKVIDTGYASPGNDGWKPINVDLSDIEAGKTIYIFTKGNNFQSVEYTYYALPQTYTYDWDFAQVTGNEAWAVDSKGALTSDQEFVNNERALTLKTGVSLDKSGSRVKMGGKTTLDSNGYPTNRALIFKAQGGGTLSYEQSSASSSGAGRNSYVSVGNGTNASQVHGPVESKYNDGGEPSVTVDLSDVEAGSDVIIWVDNGVNIKNIKWVELR
ncbi:MAG TPA: hypothetical protein DEB64_04815 [Alistipes sp.]|uniref:hypothetical protein n=1 Tax=uncultured Alistipes sp. TaxID=538949 RepID=UPI000E96AEAD|nr:hypothetical protein [uncultured Alistipes sp.]HBV50098.1 hypothetical protein [Alistipes sp.]